MLEFVVVKYEKVRVSGGAVFRFVGVMSGMGKNRGTWDASHSRSAAYRHAKALRAESGANFRFKVESAT